MGLNVIYVVVVINHLVTKPIPILVIPKNHPSFNILDICNQDTRSINVLRNVKWLFSGDIKS